MANTQDEIFQVGVALDEGSAKATEKRIEDLTKPKTVDLEVKFDINQIRRNSDAIQSIINKINFDQLEKNIANMAKSIQKNFDKINFDKMMGNISDNLEIISQKTLEDFKTSYRGFSAKDFFGERQTDFSNLLKKYYESTDAQLATSKTNYKKLGTSIANEAASKNWLDTNELNKFNEQINAFREQVKNAQTLNQATRALNQLETAVNNTNNLKIFNYFESQLKSYEKEGEKLSDKVAADKKRLDGMINDLAKDKNRQSANLDESAINSLVTALQGQGEKVKSEAQQVKVDIEQAENLIDNAIDSFFSHEVTTYDNGESMGFAKVIESLLSLTHKINKKLLGAWDNNSKSLRVSITGFEELEDAIDGIVESASSLKNVFDVLDASGVGQGLKTEFSDLDVLLDSITNNFKELQREFSKTAIGMDAPDVIRKNRIDKNSGTLNDLSKTLKNEKKSLDKLYKEQLEIRNKSGRLKASNAEEARNEILSQKSLLSTLRTGVTNYNKPLADKDRDIEGISATTYRKVEKSIDILKQYLFLGGKVEDLNIEGLTSKSKIVKDLMGEIPQNNGLVDQFKHHQKNVKMLEQEIQHYEELIAIDKQYLELSSKKETDFLEKPTQDTASAERVKTLEDEISLLKQRLQLQEENAKAEKESIEKREQLLKEQSEQFEREKAQLYDKARKDSEEDAAKKANADMKSELQSLKESAEKDMSLMRENTKKQSDEILQNAHKQSEEMLRDIQAKSDNIKNEAEAFKQASLQEIESAKKELQSIKEQATTELEQAKKQQNELLESAEKQSKAVVEQAQQQANAIIDSAKEQANQISEKSRQDAENLKKAYEEQEKALNEQLEAKKRAIAEQEEEEKKKYSAIERENIAHDVKRGISDRLEGKVDINVDSKGAVSITKEFTDATGAVTKFTDHFKDAETAIENFEYGNATGSTKFSVPFNDMVLSATEATEAAQKVKTELKDVLSSTAQVGVDHKGFIQIKDEIKDVDGNLVSVIQRFHSAEEAIENFGNTAYSTNVKIKPGKTEKPVEKNKLTVDEYNAVSKKAMTSAKRSLTRQGFKYMDVDTKRLENGISTVTAKIRDANGQWMDFVAKIDASGKIFDQQKTVINQADKLEQRYNDSNFKKLNTKQVEDATKRVESSLKWKGYDDATVKVAENGSVTITRSFKDMNGEIVKTIDYFETVNKAINNYGKTADKTSRSVSFKKDPENKLTLDEFNKVRQDVVDNTRKLLSGQGYEILDLDTKHLENGLSTIVAKIKDADGVWSDFTGKFNASGDLISQQFKTLTKTDELENKLENQKLNAPENIKKKFADFAKDIELFESLSIKYSGSNAFQELIPTIQILQNAFQSLNDEIEKGDDADFEKINNKLKELSPSVKQVSTAFENLEKPIGNLGKMASNKTIEWMRKNTKALKEYGDTLEEVARLQEAATTKGELDIANNMFDMTTSHARAQGKIGLRWQDSMKGLARLTRDMFGSFSIVNRADDIVREVGRTVHEVDDALTELKMATNVSNKEANSLMETYSKMGRELKATGVDVSTAATSFLKQGETIAASQKLAHDSIVLSKVGNLSAEESTKYLTSAMKGYKVEAEGALSIVDKLSAVDMASATDVGGLAEAMSKVASSADLAGISMDRLLGYLAVVGETTQADMASVGTAFKSIFARMGNIKLSKLKTYQNELGEDLSDVETVLKGEGVNLRDESHQFRNFGDVLDEVADNWKNYSSVSQRAIAKAFAGKQMVYA